jgi:histidinol-phosphate aminotransferase
LHQGVPPCFRSHAFAVYPLASMSAGAECLAAPAKNYGHDPAAMLRGDTRRHRIWSGSPTRTIRPAISCRRPKCAPSSRKSRPTSCVVLDEAYTEYLAPADRADTVAWVRSFPNLLVVRTFSKIYGLAGLRVGYGHRSC